MFNKNRANLARAIFDDIILILKMSFQLKLNLIIGVTYLKVNPSNLIMTPEIIQSILR